MHFENVHSILHAGGIPYYQNVTFPELKHNGAFLTFDFFFEIDGRRAVIELDDYDKFHTVPDALGDPVMDQLVVVYKQDAMRRKNVFTSCNGISLLRISYDDFDRIDLLVDDFIQCLKFTNFRIDHFSSETHYKYPYGRPKSCLTKFKSLFLQCIF